jgi:hypothetical protein
MPEPYTWPCQNCSGIGHQLAQSVRTGLIDGMGYVVVEVWKCVGCQHQVSRTILDQDQSGLMAFPDVSDV